MVRVMSRLGCGGSTSHQGSLVGAFGSGISALIRTRPGVTIAGLVWWVALGSVSPVAGVCWGLQDSKASAPADAEVSDSLPVGTSSVVGDSACDEQVAPRGEAGATPTPLDFLPALLGDYFRVDSRAVGRPFHIYVRLPQGYEAGDDRRYPVVYVLDGDSLFPILAATHLFLAYDIDLPEAIVVGVAYGAFDSETNKRGFDYTVPSPSEGDQRGGAEAFHRFLTAELIPRIERRFSADPARRILFGQSRGGSFALYSAFEHPDVFWGRIATNPVFEPGRELFFSPVTAPSKRSDLGLVVTSGSNDRPLLREAALEWRKAWPSEREAPWDHEVLTIDGGTHSADSARSYRQGMSWLFCRDPERSRESRLCSE